MRVAVIGAGVTGLVAGRRLAEEGHHVEVFERWPGLGGQAATVDIGDGVLLERYYHHLFTSDLAIQELYEELGLHGELEWLDSSVAVFADGRLWPFTTPLDLLRFRPMPLHARLRMGGAVLMIQKFGKELEHYEAQTARQWVQRVMGPHAWDRVWGPMLRGKFADRADDISMAWLWSKLTLRRQMKGAEARQEKLGYPRRSWELLFDHLRARIESAGGQVWVDRPVARIGRSSSAGLVVTPAAADSFRRGLDPRRFQELEPTGPYDAVVATVPSDIFARLLTDDLAAEVGPDYLSMVEGAEYCEALCLLLEVDRRLTPYYWSNVADDTVPFIGVIEHTNFIAPERYGGRRFVYVANYLPAGSPLLALDADQLLEHYRDGLARLSPGFSPSWVKRCWRFREPAAQPIVTMGHGGRIPPMATPAAGLFLANTQQIYPEDRGTNYSVRLGERAAAEVLEMPDRSVVDA